MSIQDLDDSLENYGAAMLAMRSNLNHISNVAKAYGTTAPPNSKSGFEAIEEKIDNTIKDLQELRKKMYMELTEINDLIAKLEECGGSQDEL